MSLVKLEKCAGGFPIEIFGYRVAESFKDLAIANSIPLDYIGTAALTSVAGLSGNMYRTELADIKNIFYSMLVGPSGLGKSPAFRLVCGDVIKDIRSETELEYRRKKKAYDEEVKRLNKGQKPDQAKPLHIVRVANSGTPEALMRHAEFSKAGLFLNYDEGGTFFNSIGAYKKESDNIAFDFWNTNWNGGNTFILRTDEDRERFVNNTSISTLLGMQTERVASFFTGNAMASGIASRFLMCISDYIPLNRVDPFSDRKEPAEDWKALLVALFNRGINYALTPDVKPVVIYFEEDAKTAYTELCNRLIKEADERRLSRSNDAYSEYMINYDSKLYQYAGRFLIPLCLINNYSDPRITTEIIHSSELLYRFFRAQAEKVITPLADQHTLNISGQAKTLLDSIGNDLQTGIFGMDEIKKACKALKINEKCWHRFFNSYYKPLGFIEKRGKGTYEKL